MARSRRVRGASPLPLLQIILLLQRSRAPRSASASSAASLFPPSHDEYDQTVFDPRSMFGAPYGGYARASRSRLAALPLRLVGGAGFDLPPLVETEEVEDEREAGAEDGGEEYSGEGGSTSGGDGADGGKPSPEVPYFQLSDGRGRRFVCRPYHEDELEPESVMGSMFDAPILRDAPLAADDDDNDHEDRVSTVGGDTVGGDASGEYVHLDNRIPASHLGHRQAAQQQQAEQVPAQGSQAAHSEQRQQGSDQPLPRKGPVVPIHASDIANQLSKLKGVCAQIHLGWWSYEWCHETAVSQFHVNVLDESVANSAVPGARRFEIESVTNLGKYQNRVVRVDDGRGGMPHFAPQDSAATGAGGGRGLSGSIVITETYIDGDWCDEARVHRATQVEMRCCNKGELKALQQMAEAEGEEDAKSFGPQAMFLSVFEPPGQTCQYRAKVCSPLLCPDAFQELEEDESRGPRIGVLDGDGSSSFVESSKETGTKETGTKESGTKETGVKDTKPTANEAQGPPSSQKTMVEEKPVKKGKKESIRDILERTLGNHCLQRNAGWWTYELCHTRHVREFHGANKIDMVTGVSRQVVEEEHMLGHYDIDALESFPDEEEVNYVVNATDPDLGSKGKKAAKGVKPAGTPPPPQDAGGNGAVFMQEYLHGDVCEDPDVTDSVVKAGGIVDGGIQRATTVRFSCGKNYELVKVNEDSTCHYVFDVTVPALCKHPLFKAPVVKTQVVKCLPID